MTTRDHERLRNLSLQGYLAVRAALETQQAENSSARLSQYVVPTLPFDEYLRRQFTYEYVSSASENADLTIAYNLSQYILEITHMTIQKQDGTFTMSDLLLIGNPLWTLDLSPAGGSPYPIAAQSFGSGNGLTNVMASDRSIDMWLAPQEQLVTTISGYSVTGTIKTLLYGRAWYRPDIPL